MTTIPVTLFAASLGAFLAAAVQWSRTNPKVESFREGMEGYLKRRIDEVLTSSSPPSALRERILKLLKDRDFRLALADLRPTGYFRAAGCFAGSGVFALVSLALEAANWWVALVTEGLAIGGMVFGAYFFINDIWYYHSFLERILREPGRHQA